MPKYRLIHISSTAEADNYKTVILGLWKRNLPALTPDCFDWVYKQNPSGMARTVLAQCVDSGEYVGCAGASPKTMYVLGKPKKAAVLINFAIDREHRVFGPALMMQKEIVSAYLSKDFDFIYAYPNRGSEGIFKRAGYNLVGVVNYWSKILDWKYKLNPEMLGTVMNLFTKLAETCPALDGKTEIMNNAAALGTRNYEEISETAYDHRVFGSRDIQYLKWRYLGSEYASHEFFCVNNRNKKCSGYVIFKINADDVTISDLIAKDTRGSRMILSVFINQMRKAGYRRITLVYFGNATFNRILKSLFFISRHDPRPVLISLGSGLNEQEKDCLMDQNNWYAFDGDLDL